MTDDYDHSRRDGLRLALAILAAEEAKWAALLGGSRSGRTNAIRAVRHKAMRTGQKRIGTVLSRLTPKRVETGSIELTSALDRLGL